VGCHRSWSAILKGTDLLVRFTSDLAQLYIEPLGSALVFFFLIGAVAPFIPWALTKKYPNSFVKYIKYARFRFRLLEYPILTRFNSIPVILNGTGAIPPATAINYIPWA